MSSIWRTCAWIGAKLVGLCASTIEGNIRGHDSHTSAMKNVRARHSAGRVYTRYSVFASPDAALATGMHKEAA